LDNKLHKRNTFGQQANPFDNNNSQLKSIGLQTTTASSKCIWTTISTASSKSTWTTPTANSKFYLDNNLSNKILTDIYYPMFGQPQQSAPNNSILGNRSRANLNLVLLLQPLPCLVSHNKFSIRKTSRDWNVWPKQQTTTAFGSASILQQHNNFLNLQHFGFYHSNEKCMGSTEPSLPVQSKCFQI
jgi:hypothetical protein